MRPSNRPCRDGCIYPSLVAFDGHGAVSLVDIPVNESRSFHSLEEPETVLGRSFCEKPFVRILTPGMSIRNSVIVAHVEMLNGGEQEGECHRLKTQAASSRTQLQTNSHVRFINCYRGLRVHPSRGIDVIRVWIAEVGKERLQSEPADQGHLAGHSIQHFSSEFIRLRIAVTPFSGSRRVIGPREVLASLWIVSDEVRAVHSQNTLVRQSDRQRAADLDSTERIDEKGRYTCPRKNESIVAYMDSIRDCHPARVQRRCRPAVFLACRSGGKPPLVN